MRASIVAAAASSVAIGLVVTCRILWYGEAAEPEARLVELRRVGNEVRFVLAIDRTRVVAVEPGCDCMSIVASGDMVKGVLACDRVESWVTPGVIVTTKRGTRFVATPCE